MEKGNNFRTMYNTCVMKDGSRYTGQMMRYSYKKDGIGYIIYPDGSLFEGVFKQDDTVKGRYIFPTGHVYEGEMKNHKMHGHGVLKLSDKVIYEGAFEDGNEINDDLKLRTTKDISNSALIMNKKETPRVIQFEKT